MSGSKNTKTFCPDIEVYHRRIIHKIPDDLTFAGEKIHFKSPDAYIKYYQELSVNTISNSSTRLLMRNVNVWLPYIEVILVQNRIPVDFKYVAVAESNLNNASNSHKGAAGLWQFTAITAQQYGLEVNEEVDERYNWHLATIAACKYFKQAYKQFGTWTSAVASYNRGITGLQMAFQKQSVNSYYDLQLNKETSKYIYRILALKDVISSPKKYNLKHSTTSRAPIKLLKIDTSITNLKVFAQTLELEYDILKAYNPWILGNTLTIKAPYSYYYLTIPHNTHRITPNIADTNRTIITKGYSLMIKNKNKQVKITFASPFKIIS